MARCLLFDLDGTLIETIGLYEEACIAALADHGIEMSSPQFFDFYCRPSGVQEWVTELGGDVSKVPDLRILRDKKYIDLLSEKVEWLPSALELMQSLSGQKIGIITGSRKSYVDAIHKKLRVEDFVDTIVNQDDMDPYNKPHPHGLLLASTRLGVEPADCVYVGDQLFDVQAAKAAGMKSVLIPGRYTPELAKAEADLLVENLTELLQKLED